VEGSENMMKCRHPLFPKLYFTNDSEKNTFNDYLEFKGLFLHKQVYEAFLLYQDAVSYHELSTYIKYDKGLRNVLYRNLSAIEEFYRSRLINKYDIERELTDFKKDVVKNGELVESNGSTSNLYNYTFCKSFDMYKLISMLSHVKLLTYREKTDLNRIRDFRNKVMHHNLLILSSHTSKDNIETEIREIEFICELIYNYLPEPMRGAFQGNINKCNHITANNKVPNLEILCVREMSNGIFR
jgi:hypothetical protein